MEKGESWTDLSLNRIKWEIFCDCKDRPVARTKKTYSASSLPVSFTPKHFLFILLFLKVRDATRRGDVVVHYSCPICGRSRGCTSPSIKVSQSLNEEGSVKDNIEIGNPSIARNLFSKNYKRLHSSRIKENPAEHLNIKQRIFIRFISIIVVSIMLSFKLNY